MAQVVTNAAKKPRAFPPRILRAGRVSPGIRITAPRGSSIPMSNGRSVATTMALRTQFSGRVGEIGVVVC